MACINSIYASTVCTAIEADIPIRLVREIASTGPIVHPAIRKITNCTLTTPAILSAVIAVSTAEELIAKRIIKVTIASTTELKNALLINTDWVKEVTQTSLS